MIEPILSFELSAMVAPPTDHSYKKNWTEQQAILHAFQKEACEENGQDKAIFILNNLLLRPFTIFSAPGK